MQSRLLSGLENKRKSNVYVPVDEYKSELVHASEKLFNLHDND